MRKLSLSAIFLLGVILGRSQSPTWANDIACLLYTHCTACHHEDGIAPFSLTSYMDAYNYMAIMSSDVNAHIMPPYPPDVTYQQYQEERYLTQSEINLLNAWINAGGPEGDSAQAPVMPVYQSGAVITNPGFTARIPTFTVPQLSTDLYRCFIISNPFTETEYITGIEVIPGNNAAVHHVLVFQDTSNVPVTLDSASSGPGYTEFGGDGSPTATLVGAWTPGSSPYFLPSGMGIEVPAGARIILQIHYPVGSSGLTDSTRLNLQFSSTNNLRKVYINDVLNYITDMTNGPLHIPANTVDTFYEQYTVPAKVTVLAVAPHAHLICTKMETFGVEPGGDTIPFISDTWNFHWQGLYAFKRAIVVPSGTVLHGQAIYDNTENNPLNPNDPPETVSAGEATTDEMMLFFYSYTLYQAGDENLVFDSTTYLHTYDNCVYEPVTSAINELPQVRAVVYPNPATGMVEVSLSGAAAFKAQITDVAGNEVFQTSMTAGYNQLDISHLASGMYFITVAEVNGGLKPQTLRVVKQ